ncbi:hypothetical protein [Serratia sp. (in: enterobacteria)]|uniref:hypothetical protein n=1 Tax=Serratia sp. (in: enterobacteria) TaxID=616 RepID=UPI0039899034
MTTVKSTGKFITHPEHFTVVQLFGEYSKNKTEQTKLKLNTFLNLLSVKYGYDWTTHEIKIDTGEIMQRHKGIEE